MNNLGIIVITALAVVILILAGAFFIVPESSDNNLPPQGNDGIEITLPKANSTIASPLEITGTVKGNGWTGFEGQVGTVQLIDGQGNVLATTYLQAVGEWMTLPVNFKATLAFDTSAESDGKLVFHNENASGDPEREKTFTLPVKIPNTNTQAVSVFFNAPGYECENVIAAKRSIPKTEAPARAALEELFKGPSEQEKALLFTTSINTGIIIKSLTIENGIAKVDFNEALQAGVAGSCKVTGIRAQIEQTLKQFSTVQSVVISIDGKVEDILQP